MALESSLLCRKLCRKHVIRFIASFYDLIALRVLFLPAMAPISHNHLPGRKMFKGTHAGLRGEIKLTPFPQ